MGGSSSSRMVDDGHDAMPCPPSYFCDVIESSKFPLQQPNGGGGVEESSVRIKNIEKLAKDPPAAVAKRRNKDRIHPGKPDQVHKDQTIPRSKFSAESLKVTEGKRKKVDYSPAAKQVWRVKEKPEPSKSQGTDVRPSENAMKSLPEVQKSVKGKAEGLSVQGSLSKTIHQGRGARKNKHPVLATEKSGKQTSAAPKQVMPVKNKRLASNDVLTSTVSKPREKRKPLDAGMARDVTEPSMETFKFGAVETISKSSSNPPDKAQQKVEPARAIKKTTNQSSPAPNQSSNAKGKRGKEKVKPANEKNPPEKAQQRVEPSRAIKQTTNQSPPAPNQSSKAKGKRKPDKEKVNPAKEKATPSDAPPKSSSKPNPSRQRRRRRRARQYSIECRQDIVEEIGHKCLLCEKDLIHSPLTSNDEATYNEAICEEAESCKLPDAAVLPCGHAFHVLCLEDILTTDQMTDPLCLLCHSLC